MQWGALVQSVQFQLYNKNHLNGYIFDIAEYHIALQKIYEKMLYNIMLLCYHDSRHIR